MKKIKSGSRNRKKIYTSNFNISGKDKNAVAISIGIPKWYNGRRYMLLAPTWEMVNKHKTGEMTNKSYIIRYNKILSKLNLNAVLKAFPSGSILLCWEKPGDFCHRRLVAKWIEKETGMVVPELSEQRLEEFFDL